MSEDKYVKIVGISILMISVAVIGYSFLYSSTGGNIYYVDVSYQSYWDSVGSQENAEYMMEISTQLFGEPYIPAGSFESNLKCSGGGIAILEESAAISTPSGGPTEIIEETIGGGKKLYGKSEGTFETRYITIGYREPRHPVGAVRQFTDIKLREFCLMGWQPYWQFTGGGVVVFKYVEAAKAYLPVSTWFTDSASDVSWGDYRSAWYRIWENYKIYFTLFDNCRFGEPGLYRIRVATYWWHAADPWHGGYMPTEEYSKFDSDPFTVGAVRQEAGGPPREYSPAG